MASIDLTGIKITSDQLVLIDRSGAQQGLGASMLQVDRPGARWAIVVNTPAMEMEPHGRRWQALLLKAKKRGALLRIEEPGLNIGSPGAPVIAADTATGRVLTVEGLTPGYVIRFGKWLSVVHEGQRYLDQVAEEAIANADGEAEIELQNIIRVPFSAGDVVELARPMIEGLIPDELALDRPLDHLPALSFRIEETE